MRLFAKSLATHREGKSLSSEEAYAAISIPAFVKAFITLLLIGLCIRFFHIEEDLRLFDLMLVVIPGFLVSSFLPLKARMPFFFIMNVAVLILLFGVGSGLAITGACLLFIGITLLPLAWRFKVALIALATALLILFKIQVIQWGNSVQVVTIVGVLIMFRSLLYLYELQFEKEDPGIWKRINYFILLPNLIFYIFPIVDYRTFVKRYYDRPAVENYQKGLKWMFTGLIHLLTYRIIYYYLTPAPSDIKTIYDLVAYMAISYALVVRLSGFFHFSAGLICLFGFNLPETFNNFFLATSFSDLWRRINIYWRDFVTRLFYFPIYFKFKKRNNRAIFITVLIVFFFNWFLHAYQWFWIRGSFPLKANDMLFWALLGVLVAVNSIQQKNAVVKKSKGEFDLREAFSHTLRILAMLAAMSFLWTFWISPGLTHWWELITQIEPLKLGDFGWFAIGFALLMCLGIALHYAYYQFVAIFKPKENWNLPHIYLVNGILILLVALGNPLVSGQIQQRLEVDVEPILKSKLNKFDQEQLFQGYYEELIVSNNLNSRMWEVKQDKQDLWRNLRSLGMHVSYPDSPLRELKANQKISFKTKPFSTNSFGMRDKEYTVNKPPNTFRIALLGASIEMGSGVGDGETFENILEEKLRGTETFEAYDQLEILNFAIAGIQMPAHVAITERKAITFQPDLLIYTTHTNEFDRSLKKFARIMRDDKVIQDYPRLIELATAAGLDSSMSEMEAFRLLKPFKEQLLIWGFDRITAVCKRENIRPVMIYIQALSDVPQEGEIEFLKELVESRGFYFIDMHDVYANFNQVDLAIAPFDQHPNALGHQIMADSLYKTFVQDTSFQKHLFSNE